MFVKCPRCGSHDIEITVRRSFRLVNHDGDIKQDSPTETAIDQIGICDNPRARCRACQRDSTLDSFVEDGYPNLTKRYTWKPTWSNL